VSERYFDSIDAMITALAKARITKAVLAWQSEYGQISGHREGEPINYGRIQRILVLAYDQGAILRCALDGDAGRRAELARALRAAGVEVEERSRNAMG
jgi:hypothetical protein